MLMMLIAVFDPITIKTITSTAVNFENITISFIASILDIEVEELQCLRFQLIVKKLSRTSPVFVSEITSHLFILIYGLKITNELHQLNSDQNQSNLMMVFNCLIIQILNGIALINVFQSVRARSGVWMDAMIARIPFVSAR